MTFEIKPEDKILIIAPHPDDEVIACGGFIAKYHNQIDILCVNSSGIKYEGDTLSAEEIAQVRCDEFYATAKLAGVSGKTYIEKLWGKPVMIEEMKSHYRDYMTHFNMKDYDIILVPHRDDNHPEHRFVGNVLLKDLLKEQGYKKDLKILRYELWSPLPNPNYYEDITDFAERKEELIHSYKSRAKSHYSERILGLNKYRTLSSYFFNPEKYVEAFYIEDLMIYLQIPDIIDETTKLSKKGMEFLEYLEKYDAQEKIDKLVKKYKGKRVVLYGAGQFSQVLFQNYDLSGLNITAIADKRFEQDRPHEFFGLNCVKPNDLKVLDYDAILIANFDYKMFADILDEQILYGTKNAAVEIRPLISLNFKDCFL